MFTLLSFFYCILYPITIIGMSIHGKNNMILKSQICAQYKQQWPSSWILGNARGNW